MILKNFEYSEFDGQPNYWKLNKFSLNDKVNLLVGKNATGKSRTLNRIASLAGLLTGQQPLSLEIVDSVKFLSIFSEGSREYQYSLETKSRFIFSERLIMDGQPKFERRPDGIGQMYYEKEGKNIQFHISDNRLIISSRRDTIQHPYLESLFKWADGLRYYYFGSSREMGQKNILATVNLEEFSNGDINPHDTIQVNELYLRGRKEFGDDFNGKIIGYMREIGYDVSGLTVDKNPYTAIIEEDKSPLYMLCIKELDRNADLYQTGMSQGMFRALSLLIQITYNVMKNISSVILIDDIGEGLDFDRSSRLITILIEIAERNDAIQLIMSTNDRYVMNNVPLEYWQIIQRSGGECHVFNYRNKKEKFEEFRYMGLNNFDFLATDYINSDWKKI
jgi:energy-coupling factor transporter ATP-binding protein EcfA2